MATVVFLKDCKVEGRGEFKKGAQTSLPYVTFRDLENKGFVASVVQPKPKEVAASSASEIAKLKDEISRLQRENAELKTEQDALLKANDELAAQVESLTKPELKK